MVLKKIDLETTSLTLDELLEALDTDTEVLLTRGNTPVARIATAAPEVAPKKRILGLFEGQGWMSDDFDTPLF